MEREREERRWIKRERAMDKEIKSDGKREKEQWRER